MNLLDPSILTTLTHSVSIIAKNTLSLYFTSVFTPVLVSVVEEVEGVEVLLAQNLLSQGGQGSVSLDFVPKGTAVAVHLSYHSIATAVLLDKICVSIPVMQSETYLVEVCDEEEDRYRFGFNGMHKDNEMAGVGNSLDFGARVYDSRTGSWLSLDPLADKYPGMSPYNFVGNTPIQAVDVDGKDFEYYIKGNTITVQVPITLTGFSDIQKKQVVYNIKEKWGRKFEYTSEEGKKYNVVFTPVILSERENYKCQLNSDNSGKNRGVLHYSNNYRDNVTDGNILNLSLGLEATAHEFGHLLGLADLYFDLYYPNKLGAREAEDYDVVGANYIGISPDDIMGIAGGEQKGKVTQGHINAIGDYIMEDSKKKFFTSKNFGKVKTKNLRLGDVDKETKVKSKLEYGDKAIPPLKIKEYVQH